MVKAWPGDAAAQDDRRIVTIKSFALVNDAAGNVVLQILPTEGAMLRSKPLTLQDLLKLADDAISNARSLRD